MGTKFAPAYATLVLAYLEEKMYKKSETEFSQNFRLYLEENFKRFLDDCFLIFNQPEKDLEKFHHLLNSLHPSIRYTIDKSRKQISFLDTLIINNNGKIETDIYYKPTDSKQYLLYTSCHPKHTRNSIPYNLARRLRLIISEENTLIKRLEELREFLLKQKYPPALINDSIAKIKSINRPDIVTTFNPHNPEIFPEICNNKSILTRDSRLKYIFKNKTFLKSKRQPPSLRMFAANI